MALLRGYWELEVVLVSADAFRCPNAQLDGAFIVASTSLQPYQIVPGVSAFH